MSVLKAYLPTKGNEGVNRHVLFCFFDPLFLGSHFFHPPEKKENHLTQK